MEPSPATLDFLSGVQDVEPDCATSFPVEPSETNLHITELVADEQDLTLRPMQSDMSLDAFYTTMVSRTDAALATRLPH